MNVKELIKPGMVVVTKSRGNYFVAKVNDKTILLNKTGYNRLDDYGEDGTIGNSSFNIEEIRRVCREGTLSGMLEDSSYELIWKRRKEVLLSEIFEALTGKTDYNIYLLVIGDKAYNFSKSGKDYLKDGNIVQFNDDSFGLVCVNRVFSKKGEKKIDFIGDNMKYVDEPDTQIVRIFSPARGESFFWNSIPGKILWETPSEFILSKEQIREVLNLDTSDFDIVVDIEY